MTETRILSLFYLKKYRDSNEACYRDMKETTFDAVLDKIIEDSVDWLNETFSSQFDAISNVMEASLTCVEKALLYPPFYLLIAFIGFIAWRTAGRGMTIFTVLSLLFCHYMNLWHETMITAALVIVATAGGLLIAIPFGILAASNNVVNHITRPIMDFLQTMPPYVYLIPAIALLGFGGSSAISATAIMAIPPALRLTNLGIRQVPVERLEVGKAFGATSGQVLMKIQIPSALPTIMAGVNQSLMLALSRAVIAGIIGAGGLGKEVYAAIRFLEIGKAFDAGLAIVILAIILDRISQGAINLIKKGPREK